MDYNQAILTTKYVLEQNSKIVYVFHSPDGWQFFGNEKNIDESDSRITSLKRIIELNPNVVDVLWISENMEAWINENDNNWNTSVAKYD